MLYLSRKLNQSVIINGDIEITVVAIEGKTVKLGITFPPHVTVLRKEIHERIRKENLAASQTILDVETVDALVDTKIRE